MSKDLWYGVKKMVELKSSEILLILYDRKVCIKEKYFS